MDGWNERTMDSGLLASLVAWLLDWLGGSSELEGTRARGSLSVHSDGPPWLFGICEAVSADELKELL